MVTGVRSIIRDSSCHLLSELEGRLRDPWVNETNTWQCSVEDIGIRLREFRLGVRVDCTRVPQWQGQKSQWSRVGCLWSCAIRISTEMSVRGQDCLEITSRCTTKLWCQTLSRFHFFATMNIVNDNRQCWPVGVKRSVRGEILWWRQVWLYALFQGN